MAEPTQTDDEGSLDTRGHSATILASKAATTADDLPPLDPTIYATSGSTHWRVQPGHNLPEVPRERFEFLGTFAKGGVGRIVRAHEPHLGRTVAVKELRQSEPESRERFVREVQLTARLQHPGIVPVYDAGCWPSGDPFFSMKLVSGKPFSRVIRKAKNLGQRLALLPHVLAVAEAIAYAHSQRIIHRDLKPQNILVGSFGETVVIDWGLAKDLAAEPTDSSRSLQRDIEPRERNPQPVAVQDSQISEEGLTLTGTVMGTPSYMPPEQAIGVTVDERADVYALGAILYHVLAGQPPYTGESSVDVLTKVTMGPPTPLRRLERKLPHELVTIVQKAMARNPDQRYPTAADFAEDLRRFQTGKIVGAHNYTTLQRLTRFVRRYRAPLVSLALLGAMGAVSVNEIIQERDLAERGRQEAEQARAVANEQRQEARAHADQLTLEQARIAVEGDPSKVLELLSQLSPDFHAWDVARVIAADARAQGLPVVLRGHTATTTYVSFHPTRPTIFTASDDGSIREWNLQTGEELRTLAGHTDEVWVVQASADGRYLLSAGKDRTARLWDLKTGSATIYKGHTSAVFTCLFLPDGNILTIGHDGTFRVWDRQTGKQLASYDYHRPEERIFPLIDITDDGAILLREQEDGNIGILNRHTGQTWSLEVPGIVAFARLNPDGKHVAAATTTGKLYTFSWSPATKTYEPVKLAYDSTVSSMGFADDELMVQDAAGGRLVLLNIKTGAKSQVPLTLEPVSRFAVTKPGPNDERWVATGAGSGVVYLVELRSGQRRALRKFQDSTLSLEFSPDGKKIAATSFDHTVRVWDVQTPSHQLLTTNQHPLVFGRPLADGRVLTGDSSGMVYLHNLTTREIQPQTGHQDPLTAVALDSSGLRRATGDRSGRIITWTDEGRTELTKLHSDHVRGLAYAGDVLVSVGEDGQAIVWPRQGKPRVLTQEKRPLRVLASAPDGRHVAFGGRKRVVTVWDQQADQTRTLEPFDGTISAISFANDGQILGVGTKRHELRVVNLQTGQTVDIDAGGNGVASLCFSHDNQLVFVAGLESTIRVWDTQTGQSVNNLRGHRASVHHIALSPDGDRLVSISADQSLRLWSLTTWREPGEQLLSLRYESRELRGHSQRLLDAAFTPDGRAVLSTSADGTLRLWPDDLPRQPEAFHQWLRNETSQATATSH